MLKISTTLLLLAILASMPGCDSTKKVSEEKLERIAYTSEVDSLERDYFLYLPKGYGDDPAKKWPVMLFLHGNGERGNGKDELDYVLIHGPLYEAWIQKHDLPFVLIVPQLHMFGMDSLADYIRNRTPEQIPKRLENGTPEREAEYPTPVPMMGALPDSTFSSDSYGPPYGWEKVEHDLLGMIDHVLDNYQVDANRLYLSGLSYGGFGTWYMASKHPERFAAIAPVVGWGHPALMEPIAKANIPVWAFAGGRDEAVRAKYFYTGMNKLEELGNQNVRFTIHEDCGHDTWKRVFAGDDLYNWLLNFSKEK